MPLRAICHKCRALLYEGDLRPPYEIIPKYEGRCPSCGKKLLEIPIETKVEPLEPKVKATWFSFTEKKKIKKMKN